MRKADIFIIKTKKTAICLIGLIMW